MFNRKKIKELQKTVQAYESAVNTHIAGYHYDVEGLWGFLYTPLERLQRLNEKLADDRAREARLDEIRREIQRFNQETAKPAAAPEPATNGWQFHSSGDK